MHAVNPDQLEQEQWQGFPFTTLLAPQAGSGLGVYELTVTRANPHTHDDVDQVYIVRSGRGVMQIGAERTEVGPGWLVHIPRGQRHALQPLPGEVVRVYSLEYRGT